MKNFLVVVIMEQVSGPKVVIVVNIKICPTALAKLNERMLKITYGCLDKNPNAATPSPEIIKPEIETKINGT